MVSRIVGRQFNRISRAADMLCLLLGEDYIFTNHHGKRQKAAQYAIHFQTQWRFRQDRTILLASRDIYEPYRADVPEDWEWSYLRLLRISIIYDSREMFKFCLLLREFRIFLWMG